MNRAKALFAEEPAMVSLAVSAGLGWAASFVVLHGIVSNTVASATVQEVTPSVVAAVMIGIGAFVRQYVKPFVTREQQALEGLVKPSQINAEALVAPTASGSVPSTIVDSQIASEPIAAASSTSIVADVPRFTG